MNKIVPKNISKAYSKYFTQTPKKTFDRPSRTRPGEQKDSQRTSLVQIRNLNGDRHHQRAHKYEVGVLNKLNAFLENLSENIPTGKYSLDTSLALSTPSSG